ncbi:hypothetical protein BGZ58_000838 [Dissophora ornata]|nr:hypothetical protein BGZ58_000838 [Dissophora ornata]
MLCDWTRTTDNCRDSDFTKYMLLVSSAAHLLVVLYGVWLLAYRNRGLNSKIITELFTKVGTGLQPRPMDCMAFFTTMACLAKIASNLLLVFGSLQTPLWFRVCVEQFFWIFVCVSYVFYFVGILYAMPVTTRQGIFAVYQPEAIYGSRPLSPIHVLTPTNAQKNFMLAIGVVYPTLVALVFGVGSAALHDRGYFEASKVLLILQYSNWVLILYAMAVMFFYYGLKYTFILRANIIIAEAALKAPRAAFGIGNLKSRSPARFLFIQLQITGFGGCVISALAGLLCFSWVAFRNDILSMKSDKLSHAMGVIWTCTIALAFFVVHTLIAIQSIRSRRRGLHDPSTTTTESHSSGKKSTKHRLSKSGQQFNNHGSDVEAGLTQHSSGDISFVGSEKASIERPHRYEDPRSAVVMHSEDLGQEVKHSSNSWTPASPTAPSRPSTSQINSSVVPTNNGHRNIRDSVFGGRTPREEGPPASPPPNGSERSSFPLLALSSTSRTSMQRQPRPSTSSATQTNPTSSLKSLQGSPKHGTSSNESQNTMALPLSPTSPVMSPTASMDENRHLTLQQRTQQQLLQLQIQQPTYDSLVSSQRTQIKAGASQAIPESPTRTTGDARGDLLHDYIRSSDQAPSSPPQSPHRTKSSASGSSSRIQRPPPIAPLPTMPLPPSTPPQPYQQAQYGGGLPRTSTSSVRSHQKRSLELNIPADKQIQQQHHLHQVAFKGLSPPPRSMTQNTAIPTSPTRRTDGTMMSVSPPTSPTASRGPGGGYQSQRIEPPAAVFTLTPQPSPLAQPQFSRSKNSAIHQQQQAEVADDVASADSAGDDAWPMPPTFK